MNSHYYTICHTKLCFIQFCINTTFTFVSHESVSYDNGQPLNVHFVQCRGWICTGSELPIELALNYPRERPNFRMLKYFNLIFKHISQLKQIYTMCSDQKCTYMYSQWTTMNTFFFFFAFASYILKYYHSISVLIKLLFFAYILTTKLSHFLYMKEVLKMADIWKSFTVSISDIGYDMVNLFNAAIYKPRVHYIYVW